MYLPQKWKLRSNDFHINNFAPLLNYVMEGDLTNTLNK